MPANLSWAITWASSCFISLIPQNNLEATQKQMDLEALRSLTCTGSFQDSVPSF